MATFRARSFFAAFMAALLSLQPAKAASADYKLGDVAAEDVITPVPLMVVNPEATEALKQKMAQQVLFVVRHSPQTATEAETELRVSIVNARANFLATLQKALDGRAPVEADLNSPSFTRTVGDVARDAPKDLPLDRLAPLWLRGASDNSVVENLLQPVRQVMGQPIVANKTDNPLPVNQPVRLVAVKNVSEPPTAQELEAPGAPGATLPAGKVLSLWRARRLVETSFPSDEEAMGRFAGSFVRVNAAPDPTTTEILRAKRMEGVTVNDTYEAAQVIVRKGQSIDRRVLSALASMREKSLIGTLQTKLEQEQTVAGQIKKQTKWIAATLGVMCLALLVILVRLRNRPGTALVPVGAGGSLSDGEGRALPGDDSWRSRAIVAEGKAERAQEAIRSGVLGWMREKIFHTLSNQRASLLSAQQKAAIEMRELEQRLEQLHTPLQERISAYEKRIEELEKDLAAKGAENRELIGARITLTKQQLMVERERRRFGTN